MMIWFFIACLALFWNILQTLMYVKGLSFSTQFIIKTHLFKMSDQYVDFSLDHLLDASKYLYCFRVH